MKQISIKGLADFMTAPAARQRTIIRQYKYPAEDDARARILYYREARDRIAVYHRRGRDTTWLIDEAARLEALAGASMGGTRTRLRHNARALRDYSRYFGGRGFEVLNDINLILRYGDVSVTVSTDLHVRERGDEKIIKLEFGVREPVDEVIRIVSQGMLEAALVAKLGLPSSGVLYLDVARGTQFRGARLGSRMRRNIEAACLTISDIWETI